MRAEWRGGLPLVGGSALLCGYLNELLLKLLAREDPHPCLYRDYEDALARLASGADRRRSCASSRTSLLASWAMRCRCVTKPAPARRLIRRTLLLRVRARSPIDAEPGRLPAGTRRDAVALADLDFAEADAAAGGEATDARGTRPLPRAARRVQPSRRARSALDEETSREPEASMLRLGVNIDHVATLRQGGTTSDRCGPHRAHLGGADGIWCTCARTGAISRTRACVACANRASSSTWRWRRPTRWSALPARSARIDARSRRPPGGHDRGGLDVARERRLGGIVAKLAGAGIMTSVFIDADIRQVEAAARRRACVRSTDRMRTPSMRAAAIAGEPVQARPPRYAPPAGRPAGWGFVSTPVMRSATSTCSRSPRFQASASSTSATPSSAGRCSSACARRCAR